ncbi:RNA methyltransferase [Candidatus Nasuia deltocephalinicola]|nr:RNA methyltransferase [Candidatus Nasuia deltocephalinicola]
MLKILSGKFKNTPFSLKNEKVKPTSTLIKKNIFNWIGNFIKNKICLDLFSGLGTLGFESVSRGAYKVILVEKNKIIYNFLKKIKKKLNIYNVFIYNLKAEDYLFKYKFEKFDIIFIDLPYNNFKYLYFFVKKCIFLTKKKSLIYIESYLNLYLLKNYFDSILKIKKIGVIGKINFFLFEVI